MIKQVLLLSVILIVAVPVRLFSQSPDITIGTGYTNRTINIGDSISIWWSVKNAKKFYCNELGGTTLPMEGSVYVSPKTSTNYLFIAEKGKQSQKKRISIDVVHPKILSFTIPARISDEATYSYNWAAENCAYVKIQGLDEEFEPEGKMILKSDHDTTIVITAFNKAGYSVSESRRVRVDYVEKLEYPKKVKIGSMAHIQWKYKNTEYVIIRGINDTFPAVGEAYVPVTGTQHYRIGAYRDNNSIDYTDFSIEAYRSKIKTFTGNTRIFSGEEVVLVWEVENADSVKLSLTGNENQNLKGKFSFKPETDTSVVLYSWLNGFEDSRELNIETIKRQLITGFTDYSQIEKGVRLDYEVFAVDLNDFPDMVHLYVLVVDTAGNFVHGLAPPTISDADARKFFIGLTETYTDGGRKEVADFVVSEVRKSITNPRNISMVLDYSGSMDGSIEAVEAAAKSFIENKREIDSLSVVKFDDKVVTECPLLINKKEILSRVHFDGLKRYGGCTALYAAIGDGIINARNDQLTNEVIVFTDGYENSSGYYFGSKAVSAQQVANMAIESQTRIHIISFGKGVNANLLEVLAGFTGGNYYNVSSDTEINGVWAELPFLAANYYRISFRTASISKLNGIRLVYNTNTGPRNTAVRKLYINDTVNFFGYEGDSTSYWLLHSHQFNGMNPVTTPQVVALYSFNGAILDTGYYSKIDNIVEFMNDDPDLHIVLFGHTDLIASDEYNQQLSERRCQSVEKFITDKGIAKERIIKIPLGEKFPVWPEEDAKWKANENRRVEVMFVKK